MKRTTRIPLTPISPGYDMNAPSGGLYSQYGVFLTYRRNDGAYKVKATGKIPAASLVDNAGGGCVAVSVQELVQPLQGQGAASQVMSTERVINPPKLRGL